MFVSQRLHSYNFVIILKSTKCDIYIPSIIYIFYLIRATYITSVNLITPSILLDTVSITETTKSINQLIFLIILLRLSRENVSGRTFQMFIFQTWLHVTAQNKHNENKKYNKKHKYSQVRFPRKHLWYEFSGTLC